MTNLEISVPIFPLSGAAYLFYFLTSYLLSLLGLGLGLGTLLRCNFEDEPTSIKFTCPKIIASHDWTLPPNRYLVSKRALVPVHKKPRKSTNFISLSGVILRKFKKILNLKENTVNALFEALFSATYIRERPILESKIP